MSKKDVEQCEKPHLVRKLTLKIQMGWLPVCLSKPADTQRTHDSVLKYRSFIFLNFGSCTVICDGPKFRVPFYGSGNNENKSLQVASFLKRGSKHPSHFFKLRLLGGCVEIHIKSKYSGQASQCCKAWEDSKEQKWIKGETPNCESNRYSRDFKKSE